MIWALLVMSHSVAQPVAPKQLEAAAPEVVANDFFSVGGHVGVGTALGGVATASHVQPGADIFASLRVHPDWSVRLSLRQRFVDDNPVSDRDRIGEEGFMTRSFGVLTVAFEGARRLWIASRWTCELFLGLGVGGSEPAITDPDEVLVSAKSGTLQVSGGGTFYYRTELPGVSLGMGVDTAYFTGFNLVAILPHAGFAYSF